MNLIRACTSATLGALIALGMTPAFAQDPVELKMFHRWPNDPFKSYIDSVIADFEAANPNIRIVTEQVLNDPYKDKIRVVVGGAALPDIFFTWSGEFAKNLVRSGRVMDLTAELEENPEWTAQFIESQLNQFKIDGAYYGVPWQMDGKAFFYNQTIFDEHELEVPETFDELLASCATLKANGVTPILFGSRAPWAVSHYMGTFNERVVPPDVIAVDYERTTGEFTHPAYIEALNKFTELGQCFNPSPNGIDNETARNAFTAGQGAMMYLTFGEIAFLREMQDPFGIFVFPAVEDGQGNQTSLLGAPQGYMISAETAYPEEAFRFLQFLISPEMGARFIQTTGSLSPVIGAVNENSARPDQIQAFEQIVQADSMYLWLDTALDSAIADVHMRGTQALLEGSTTAEEVMREVQAAAARVRQSDE